jgi:hypothetical protein
MTAVIAAAFCLVSMIYFWRRGDLAWVRRRVVFCLASTIYFWRPGVLKTEFIIEQKKKNGSRRRNRFRSDMTDSSQRFGGSIVKFDSLPEAGVIMETRKEKLFLEEGRYVVSLLGIVWKWMDGEDVRAYGCEFYWGNRVLEGGGVWFTYWLKNCTTRVVLLLTEHANIYNAQDTGQ